MTPWAKQIRRAIAGVSDFRLIVISHTPKKVPPRQELGG